MQELLWLLVEQLHALSQSQGQGQGQAAAMPSPTLPSLGTKRRWPAQECTARLGTSRCLLLSSEMILFHDLRRPIIAAIYLLQVRTSYLEEALV
uniref:Uncharacterized protein n=1 Tax=Sphaerodactylus townsendi TaxID=933632 RepID=A0ACB8GDL6_9SAUR